MQFVERIEVRAHARGTEILERVTETCLNLFPEIFRESIAVSTEKTEGHLQNPIIVVTAVAKRRKQCNATLDFIIGKFSKSDCKSLLQSLNLRLDEKCVFFLRIDKQAAFLHELKLSTEPDMISVRIHLREYPRCDWDSSLSFLEERFERIGGESTAI